MKYQLLNLQIHYLPLYDLSFDEIYNLHEKYIDTVINCILYEDKCDWFINDFINFIETSVLKEKLWTSLTLTNIDNKQLLLPSVLLSVFPKHKLHNITSVTSFEHLSLIAFDTQILQTFCASITYLLSFEFIYDLMKSIYAFNFEMFYENVITKILNQTNCTCTIKDNELYINTNSKGNVVVLDDLKVYSNTFDSLPSDTLVYIRSLVQPLTLYQFIFLYKAFKRYGIRFPVANIIEKYKFSDMDDKLTQAFITVQKITDIVFTCNRLFRKTQDKFYKDMSTFISQNILGLIGDFYKTESNCNSKYTT